MIDYLHEGDPVHPNDRWAMVYSIVNTDICMLIKQKTELKSGKRICSHFPHAKPPEWGFPLLLCTGNMLLIGGAATSHNKQTESYCGKVKTIVLPTDLPFH